MRVQELAAMASSGPPTSTAFPQRNFESSGITQNYSMNGKIIISALAILFFIVFIIILLHIYTKRLWHRSSDIRQEPRRLHGLRFSQETSITCGLDNEIVVALPVFTYKSQVWMVPKAVECAVCLSEFVEDENCKLLPKCKHFFHTDCIDMWFLSNTTCPLCRMTAADDEPLICDEEHGAIGSTTCRFTRQDGENDLGEQHQEASGLASQGGVGYLFDIRDDLACGYINSDEEQGNENRGALPRRQFSLQSPAVLRSWRRSISDKFQGVQFQNNVLFWGNHTNPGHWKIGGRSLPHITIDILRSQESPAAVSSCPSLCSSPALSSSLPQSVHRPPNRFKSLKRLLSK